MSDPDGETMRECLRCRALNSFAARVCGVCGSTLGIRSDTLELFASMMRRAIRRLERLGLTDAERDLLHKARELATYFENAGTGGRAPDGAERNDAIRRATALYGAVLDLRRDSAPPTADE